jgi:benzoylformate decarboxylase
MGDLTRNQAHVRKTLEPHDLLICLGADLLRMSPHSPVDPLPPKLPVVHISERIWELGKNYSTEIAIHADVKETLRALIPVLRSKMSAEHATRAELRLAKLREGNWSAQRAAAQNASLGLAAMSPIDVRYLMMTLAEVLPPEAIVVEEAVTAAAALSTFVPLSKPDSFYGLASGGLGFALPGAIGVSLASRGRPVVAAVGDGSSMYAIQALWTAAHLELPITYVIINNRSYRIIKDRLVSLRKSERFTGMDLTQPSIDFVALAQGLGMKATRVTEPQALAAALRGGIASGTPNLVEVAVASGYA